MTYPVPVDPADPALLAREARGSLMEPTDAQIEALVKALYAMHDAVGPHPVTWQAAELIEALLVEVEDGKRAYLAMETRYGEASAALAAAPGEAGALPDPKDAWYERYAHWWDTENCCVRCGWHRSAHADTGYGPNCPYGTRPGWSPPAPAPLPDGEAL